MPDTAATAESLDAVIVGAGFAGLAMLHRLRGLGMSARVFERGGGVGGTWYWNRYPGARCDIQSLEYSYQFSEELEQEWEWSERFASQPEILKYAEHVADRFDLRKDIRFGARVVSAHFDEAAGRWQVETDSGDRISAQFCIMATGCLSSANMPKIKGLDSFKGRVLHTGRWPHEGAHFHGKRVGIIGTGSSAIQSIPILAQQASHLTVFQRTANYSIPSRNGPMDPDHQRYVKAHYPEIRAVNAPMAGASFNFNEAKALETGPDDRLAEYEARWEAGGLPFLGAFIDLMLSEEANATAADFIRAKIRQIVHDPKTAEILAPTQLFGCKRLCVDSGYFETFNRPNVTLVDVKASPIEEVTPDGVRTGDAFYPLDDVVLATGFDAMTGALNAIDIRGKGGLALKQKWEAGPRAYLGLGVAGFPNLFLITGPGSPSVLSNMIPSIEQHVNWIADCIAYLRQRGLERIEPIDAAENAWVDHVNEVAAATLYPQSNSWYVGANIPGKPRVFMPYIGFPAYLEKCAAVVANGYEGFALAG